jgi:branched-chain amino acid transport system substrate-binding protein
MLQKKEERRKLTMRTKMLYSLGAIVVSLLLVFPALGADTIKLGALYNLTGGMSSIDAPALNGAKLQAKLINEQGGLLGKQIEVIGIDTKTDQKAAATGAKKALSAGVVAGLGYGDTTFVMAAAPLFQKKGVPFVTSGATHPMLPQWVGDYMFMTPFGDDDQSFAIADYTVKKLAAKNVVVWTDNSMDFTKALSKFYKQRLKELGANVMLEDFFMMGDKDFSAQIARLKNASPKPDAVFISAIPNEAGLTVKQIREAGLTLPIVSGDGFDTELVTTVPGDKLANDVFFSTHTYREDNRPEVLAFVDAYQKEYGRPPENAFAALGFDAVGLIADAIKRAGTTEGKALREALAGTKGFKAVTGEISYTRPTGVPMKGVSIISVHSGKYKVEEIWFPKQ